MFCLFIFFFFLMIRRPPRSTRMTHSFPTRRSSDLVKAQVRASFVDEERRKEIASLVAKEIEGLQPGEGLERIAKALRSEEHTSELQSLMRISYAVFCLKKKR